METGKNYLLRVNLNGDMQYLEHRLSHPSPPVFSKKTKVVFSYLQLNYLSLTSLVFNGVCTKRQKLPKVVNIYFRLLDLTSNFAGRLKMLS